MESEAVTEDQEIAVVPQVLLLVGAALEPQELEANGSSGNGATCTGGVQGALVAVRQSSFFICGALKTIGYATHKMHKNKLLSS